MKKFGLKFYVEECSAHMDPLYNSLTEMEDVTGVTVFADKTVNQRHVDLGWPSVIEGRYTQHINASDSFITEEMLKSKDSDVHIFLGMRHIRSVATGLDVCTRLNLPFGIISEPRVSEWPLGLLRYWQSIFTEGRLRRKAGFVLAIGALGPVWFRKVFYRPEQVRRFAYFIEPIVTPPVSHADAPPTIAYVGRLDEEKGILDFLAAIDLLPPEWRVVIVGQGPHGDACRAKAENDPRVSFPGRLPITEIPEAMSRFDIVVQPSLTTSDGWGVTISEALMSGAAGIATDVVGSSTCLHDPQRGRVVPVGTPAAIAHAATDLLAGGLQSDEQRQRRWQWAVDNISAPAGARILMDAVRFRYGDGDSAASPLDVLPPERPW